MPAEARQNPTRLASPARPNLASARPKTTHRSLPFPALPAAPHHNLSQHNLPNQPIQTRPKPSETSLAITALPSLTLTFLSKPNPTSRSLPHDTTATSPQQTQPALPEPASPMPALAHLACQITDFLGSGHGTCRSCRPSQCAIPQGRTCHRPARSCSQCCPCRSCRFR